MSLDHNFGYGDRLAERQAKAIERALVQAYTEALRSIRAELAEAYARWDMTYAEMQKYNRLAGLEKEIQRHIRALTGKQAQTLRRGLGDIYADSYYSTAWAIEREVQAKLRYTILDPKVIRAAVQMPLSGLTLDERLEARRRDVELRVRQEIVQGLIRGESYQDMARRLKDGLEIEANKAIRIARTEAHRVQVAGRRESLEHAEEMGIEGVYVWDATLDDRTRESHQDMDGQEADENGIFTLPSGVQTEGPGLSGEPSEDINCRCSLRYEIKGYSPEVRR